MKHSYLILSLSLMVLVSCQDNNGSNKQDDTTQTESTLLPNSSTTQVYKADGAKQCQSTGIAADVMAKELIAAGIDILCLQKSSKVSNTKKYILQTSSCGSVTGAINIYKINKSNLSSALSLGFKSITKNLHFTKTCKQIKTTTLPQYQKVYKRDITAQCQGTSITPTSMAKELIASGIDVFCAQKSTDGLAHPAVCGNISGNINVFKIKKEDVVKAQINGFHPVSELSNYTDTKCKPEIVKVFKPYSYIQCGSTTRNLIKIVDGTQTVKSPRTAQSARPEVMAQELITNGVGVKCSQRGNDGTGRVFAAVCGGVVKGINEFEINKADLTKAQSSGFNPVSQLPNYVDTTCKPMTTKVYKSDNSKQCQGGGIPLNVMAQSLVPAGIDVSCSQKANTGLMYAAVCGGISGSINVYSINKNYVASAVTLGFKPVTDLQNYTDKPCP